MADQVTIVEDAELIATRIMLKDLEPTVEHATALAEYIREHEGAPGELADIREQLRDEERDRRSAEGDLEDAKSEILDLKDENKKLQTKVSELTVQAEKDEAELRELRGFKFRLRDLLVEAQQ